MRLLTKALCLATLTAATLVAKADSLYSFTYMQAGTSITWLLPSSLMTSSPTPHFFVVDNVPVNYNGISELADIEFASTLIGGGLSININDQNPYFAASGPQVFIGPTTSLGFPTDSPTFLTGQYSLVSGGKAATLVITPEPSTFLLLGSGILGLAGAARRKLFLVAVQKTSAG
jgi:hypothetical protein